MLIVIILKFLKFSVNFGVFDVISFFVLSAIILFYSIYTSHTKMQFSMCITSMSDKIKRD